MWNSFERELYDMIRAAFIKYAGQCRIGRMDGAFVTYHNTQEIFGFQYVPLATMDKLVYGSSHMANLHFDVGLKLLGSILDHMTHTYAARYGDAPILVTLTPHQQSNGRRLHVDVSHVISESYFPAPADKPWLDGTRQVETGHTETWIVFVDTLVNGKVELQPWNLSAKDVLQVRYRLVEAKVCSTAPPLGPPLDSQMQEMVVQVRV